MILQRPTTVKFDPNNKEHREAVKAYMKRGSWSDSPIRFSSDPSFGSITTQVQTKLLEWYVSNEKVTPIRVRKSTMQLMTVNA